MTSLAESPDFDGHELVVSVVDKDSGLRGFIAIHNTSLGPATGGTRYALYASEEDALRDALRLSRAMTYKCALAGVPYGGGKAVMIGNPDEPKTPALLAAYARRLNLLSGSFYTGEDIGMHGSDIAFLMARSPYVNGREGAAGDLSPWTALGMASALESALQALFGTKSFEGRTIAVKGLGKIGMAFCVIAHERGAVITAADVDPEAVATAKKRFPSITIAEPQAIHTLTVDVYSPNVMNEPFTLGTVAQLNCKIICGSADDQLADPLVGRALHEKGILYLPDYLVNAGGLVSVMAEVDPQGFDPGKVKERVIAIGATTNEVLRLAFEENAPTAIVADRMAESIFYTS